MRLIVKEYISQLKEKDELDILLGEIFIQKGYIADNQPKTGNRQYGVDIQLHNKTELLLLVIKQGDINREIWDGSINAVRQSLDEIKDVTINSLTYEERTKKVRIIVATNGKKDEAIKLNWNNYVNNNQEWGGIPIKIEFMGIDNIVEEVMDNYFNECLFEKEMHSLMRKALYFIDEGDYKSIYYEQIVDLMIPKVANAGSSKKKYNKACSAMWLASQMICQYANNVGNTKVAIEVSEYVIIRYWKLLFENELLGKIHSIEWLHRFCKCYEDWNEKYVKKIESVVKKTVILPNYNVVENRVLLYEILGYLASYGNYLLDVNEKRAEVVLNYIIGLMNEYQYFVYAPYDVSINVMIMIFRLLSHFNRREEIIYLVKFQTDTLMNFYRMYNKFPAPSDTFEEAMEIEMKSGSVTYDFSALWGYYLLIIFYIDEKELYGHLQGFLNIELSKVSKCVWFLRKSEEKMFYDAWAMNTSGEGVAIDVEKNFDTFKKKMDFINKQYDDVFSFEEYCFSGLEIMICRYYDYIPRVKFIGVKQ